MSRRKAGPGPVHLIRWAGDKRSICGIKKPIPVCWAEAAPAHQYPQERCIACFEAAGLIGMLPELVPGAPPSSGNQAAGRGVPGVSNTLQASGSNPAGLEGQGGSG